jgi:peptide/nickel transport system substrate-binding protein
MFYNVLGGDIDYYLAENITIEEQTLTVTISQDFRWENGDAVTAEDLNTQLKLGAIMENYPRVGLIGDLVDGPADIRTVDDWTVAVELNRNVGERLAIPAAFGGGGSGGPVLWTPESVFGKYVEQYEDATTEDARTDVKDEVLQFRWELEDVISNGIGTIEDKNQAVVVVGVNDANPVSDTVPWDRLEHYYLSSQDQIIQSARANEIDYFAGSFREDIVPDQGWQKMYPEEFISGGPALLCNHEDDLFGQTAVKQAIAHLIDREQIASISPTNSPVPDHLTVGKNVVEQYLSDSFVDKMIQYGSTERAENVLKAADFERDEGLWYTPDGDQFTAELTTPQNSSFREPARSVGSALTEFGIETEVTAVGGGTFFPQYSNGSLRFVVEYARNANLNLFKDFKRNMYGFGGGSMQYPANVEAPPVGEPNGDLVTYDAKQMVESLLTLNTQEELAHVVRKLVWVWNYTLPVMPMINQGTRRFANTSRWDWPATKDDAWKYSPGLARMMINGDLQPR